MGHCAIYKLCLNAVVVVKAFLGSLEYYFPTIGMCTEVICPKYRFIGAGLQKYNVTRWQTTQGGEILYINSEWKSMPLKSSLVFYLVAQCPVCLEIIIAGITLPRLFAFSAVHRARHTLQKWTSAARKKRTRLPPRAGSTEYLHDAPARLVRVGLVTQYVVVSVVLSVCHWLRW